jgi:cell shape-determining protein MreC
MPNTSKKSKASPQERVQKAINQHIAYMKKQKDINQAHSTRRLSIEEQKRRRRAQMRENHRNEYDKLRDLLDSNTHVALHPGNKHVEERASELRRLLAQAY